MTQLTWSIKISLFLRKKNLFLKIIISSKQITKKMLVIVKKKSKVRLGTVFTKALHIKYAINILNEFE